MKKNKPELTDKKIIRGIGMVLYNTTINLPAIILVGVITSNFTIIKEVTDSIQNYPPMIMLPILQQLLILAIVTWATLGYTALKGINSYHTLCQKIAQQYIDKKEVQKCQKQQESK